MVVLLITIVAIIGLFLYLRKQYQPSQAPDRVAVLGRPRRGKLLRRTAAKLRREYPGQTEDWYWNKAQDIIQRHRG